MIKTSSFLKLTLDSHYLSCEHPLTFKNRGLKRTQSDTQNEKSNHKVSIVKLKFNDALSIH